MAKAKIEKSEYEKIKNLYTCGKTQPEIANIYGVSVSNISDILKSLNVKTRAGGSRFLDINVNEMYNMSKNGMTVKDIASYYGMSISTVWKRFKENNLTVDRYTYHFNEHYFDKIDSKEKAYLMGLLWADGHNRVKSGEIIIELQENDKDLLEKINRLTENERPLRKIELSKKNERWKNQYRLEWISKYTSGVLELYGMVQNKSLVLEFPDCIEDYLYSAFILGYVDGDGCISLSKENRYISLSMVGTRMFLNRVSEIINEYLGIEGNINRDERARKPICTLRYGKRDDVNKILNWLYSDMEIFMKRKYDKYQQFLTKYNNINKSCQD